MTQRDLFRMHHAMFSRLEWMRRHGVTVGVKFLFDELCAVSPTHEFSGFGATEDEALTDFAINNNLKLWNEE